MRKLKVYLAGPDVFLRDPRAMMDRKKAICETAGFEGICPLDNDIAQNADKTKMAMDISRANERLMDSCDLVIANMTPFRGPSMDVGTAYEMGYMRGKGKPVFGYSNDGRGYMEKVTAFVEQTKTGSEQSVHLRSDHKTPEDNKSMSVENFGLLDNLMLEGAVRASGTRIGVPATAIVDLYGDPGAFQIAVESAKTVMRQRQAKEMDEERRKLLVDEWTSCRDALAAWDKILVDIRQYGFSLVTLLLSADGYLFAQSGIADFAKVGVYIALLALIIGLFRQDRVHEVFIRSAVLRAMELEDLLGSGISFQISYWSERVKTGTWGQTLYIGFCFANLVLVSAGLMAPELPSNPGISDILGAIKFNWPSLLLSFAMFFLAWYLIDEEHKKSQPLNAKFNEEVNKRARSEGRPAVS